MTERANEMVERVARAMAENAGFAWENCAQSQWRSDARAGIKAMREPTDEMMAAGYEAIFDDKWNGTQAPLMGAAIEAIIDAALGDGETAPTGDEKSEKR